MNLRRAVATAALVAIGGGSSLLACPMCFGAEETSMIDGTRIGIFVLLALPIFTHSDSYGIFE